LLNKGESRTHGRAGQATNFSRRRIPKAGYEKGRPLKKLFRFFVRLLGGGWGAGGGQPPPKESEIRLRIFLEKSSDFIQNGQPTSNRRIFRRILTGGSGLADRIFKQFPSEPIFFRLKANAKRQFPICPKVIINLIK